MAYMREEIEAGAELKVETETQKMVGKGQLPHMIRKSVKVNNGLHLMGKGSIQNICLREDKDFAFLHEDTKKKM